MMFRSVVETPLKRSLRGIYQNRLEKYCLYNQTSLLINLPHRANCSFCPFLQILSNISYFLIFLSYYALLIVLLNLEKTPKRRTNKKQNFSLSISLSLRLFKDLLNKSADSLINVVNK